MLRARSALNLRSVPPPTRGRRREAEGRSACVEPLADLPRDAASRRLPRRRPALSDGDRTTFSAVPVGVYFGLLGRAARVATRPRSLLPIRGDRSYRTGCAEVGTVELTSPASARRGRADQPRSETPGTVSIEHGPNGIAQHLRRRLVRL